ncbi:MAG: hypothetical protein AAB553_02780 [Patescibacteria group bacterium]
MRIGFDLDNIFIGGPPLIPHTIIERMYKKRDHGELLYRIPSYPDQLLRQIIHLPMLRPPMKKNLVFLEALAKKNKNLYLISSRYKFLEKRTAALVKKHKLDTHFHQMFFNFANEQPHLFKNAILKELKLDSYVDDDLSLLKYVAKDNPTTTFFWLTSANYSQPLPKNIVQIRALTEITKDKKL